MKKVLITLLFVSLISSTLCIGQASITGPTSICVETNNTNSHTYTLNGSNLYNTYWAVSGGDIISQNNTSITIRWKNNIGYVGSVSNQEVCETVYPDPVWYCNNYTQWVCDWEWELQDWVNCRWKVGRNVIGDMAHLTRNVIHKR
jgi:hypothetical protein